MHEEFLNGRLIVKVGDITEEKVDAIVNAANWTLMGGGGVDGAIHRKGGPAILEACKAIRTGELPNGLPTGEAVITTSGNLASKFVIHTVGPIYGQNEGRDAELLASSYRSCFARSRENFLSSIAFPSISTGAFGFPKHLAAPIVADCMLEAISGFSTEFLITLVFFSESDVRIFLKHSGLR